VRWNPLTRFGTFVSPVVLAGATGAIAAAEGFSNAQAAGTAGAIALVGASALGGGVAAARSGIIRRPSQQEIELARQIRQGLTMLRDYLTQPAGEQRLPATPALLVQPDEKVQKWVTQLASLQELAEKFADKRLAAALSALVVAIQNIRAFVGRPQAELLALLEKEKAPETLRVLLIALLNLELTEEDRRTLLAVAEYGSGLTLEEAVRLLLISREHPEAVLTDASRAELLEAVRMYAGADKLAEFFLESGAPDVFRNLLDQGGVLAQEIFDRDELEKGLADAFWACNQVIGEPTK
jgi:hypothetical protein